MPLSIEPHPIGLVDVAGRTWRHRGRMLVTAIVKGTFAIHADGVMTPSKPARITAEERHFRGSPVASLLRASDLALHVPNPEIVLMGSAYAAPGTRAQATTVRFAVQRDAAMLVSKRLEIVGERRGRPGSAPSDPMPFDRMPIQYERALGGITSRENPVGVGLGAELDGFVTFPNVNLPSTGGVAPAGFGPIPSAWPVRQHRRGSLPWAAANTHSHVEVPDDFDLAYFQTAPLDQRVAGFAGGELLVIVNMHPQLAAIRTYLPRSRGVAMLQAPSGERMHVPLRIDTIHVEPDALRAEIVFRGALALDARHLDKSLLLAGALEQPDEPFVFPDFGLSSHIEPPPPAVRGAVHGGAGGGHSSTVVIEPTAPPKDGGTMVIEGEVAPKSLPFAQRRRRSSGSVPAVRTKAGTPWATQRSAPVKPASSPFNRTVLVEPPSISTPAPSPTAEPATDGARQDAPPPVPGPSPPPSNRKASPWREDPVLDAPQNNSDAASPPRAAPVAAPAPAPARANFKAGVLKKFKR
ncbi:MAG: DUF2169 domain-containing protein [Polyangiaceae bacterium]|nr:DUF2169 domain-containing protein [Polyangiaceae bacterium]